MKWLWVVAGLLVVGAVVWRERQQRGWGVAAEPRALPAIDATLRFLDVPGLVRAGPSRLAVVSVGAKARFEPHSYLGDGLAQPLTIAEWATKLNAPVVFNAGQYDEHLRHLGWLKSRSTWLEPLRKGAFKGLLVSQPLAPVGAAKQHAIVDLERTDLAVADRYANVVQSMMLVDEGSQVRVRQSGLAACRTVVAEDRAGRMLVMVSEGAVTLHDLASWLPSSGLDIVRAINLDGGAESQLAVDAGGGHVTFAGHFGHDNVLTMRRPMRLLPMVPLPAVVAIVPGG